VTEILVNDIRIRYERVQAQIQAAAMKAGRAPEAVRLVVVTKTHPLDAVLAAIQAGARVLGENYAEEAVQKIGAIASSQVEWHMIGHVQSRKADLVAQNFHMIHSLDSLKLANRLSRFCVESGRSLTALLECNVSGEESKFGYAAWDDNGREALCRDIEQMLALPNLKLSGLMTMPPLADDPEESRPFFRRLRELAEFLSKRFPQTGWEQLSMGTTADFTVAVEEGATLVRVGTAIMGPRPAAGQ
jgi:pyridoxal phosphate enzyme (YggS family)